MLQVHRRLLRQHVEVHILVVTTILWLNHSFMKSNKGFTLIELMISLSIIAVLSMAGFFSYQTLRANTRDQARLRDLNSVKQALEAYRGDNRQYPTDLSSLVPKYMTAVPHDPQYSSADTSSPDYKYQKLSGTDYVVCGLKENGSTFTAPSGCSSLKCTPGKTCNIGVSPQ